MKVITTVPMVVNYDIRDIVKYSFISGIRVNTSAHTNEPIKRTLYSLYEQTHPKDLWIDLKGRQVRTAKECIVPDEYVELTHEIKLNPPMEFWFDEGKYTATITEVEGNKIKIQTYNNQKLEFGRGMSLNIIGDYEVDGYLTKRDKQYIKAAKQLDLHNYMISYVERGSDIEEILKLDPKSKIIAKIETKKALKFIEKKYKKYKSKVRLLCARGDLYVNLDRPHYILEALETVIKADSNAITASRFLSSLNTKEPPRCQEICDIGLQMKMGYKTLLLGDEVCEDKETLLCSLGILKSIEEDYKGEIFKVKGKRFRWLKKIIGGLK